MPIGSGAFNNTGYYNDESNWHDEVLYIDNYLIDAKETIEACHIKQGTKVHDMVGVSWEC